MKAYLDLDREELKQLHEELLEEYDAWKEMGLSLNMARGKPSDEQLQISKGMMTILGDVDLVAEDGTDVRNYGVLDGIPEAKRLMGDLMGVKASQTIIFGNSSLNAMYDTVARAYMFGIMGSIPWCRLDHVRFLCPVPGYDRHFGIISQFGFEMIPIPMNDDGPDMDLVEKYVNHDPYVKGIWCVPLYSNPTGIVYSDETVRRFARLKPAAKDFRIFWDNAYAIHHLYPGKEMKLLNIMDECEKAGNPDIVYQFASTSKITFPGSGIAAISASENNIKDILSHLIWQTIGYDKINQFRHVRFFGDIEGMRRHMERHADILRPKFDGILNLFDQELKDLGIAEWTRPYGGYFISFNAMEGCAKKIVSRCREAGVVMTAAGATFPGGVDPKDSNIRIAPSFPPLDEILTAAKLFITCVKLVTVEKLLEEQEEIRTDVLKKPLETSA